MIWKRYFLKELAKVFFLVIGGFYFLYVLIDYSAHTKTFHQDGIRFVDIIIYYLFQFTKRADLLIPVALLIALVKVLTSLHTRNEIVAMVSAGMSMKTLMRPFFFAATLCAVALYLNFQLLQPLSLTALTTFEESYFKAKSNEKPIGVIPLIDSSLLLYQKFDPETHKFSDVYWIQSIDLIYRIQSLCSRTKMAEHVDILKREDGRLKRAETHDSVYLTDIQFDSKSLFTVVHPPHSQSLTQLFANFSWGKPLNDKESEVATLFYYKLAIPLACFLVVYAPAPFCLRFSRHLPVFMIYALSVFGIITFFTLVNACAILGKSQVMAPFWAILTPFVLFFGLFGWRYAKF